MLKQFFYFICVTFCLFFTSCITNKDIVYLQEKDGVTGDSLQIHALVKPYRVQINDMLSIDVKALDKELVEIFNPTTKDVGNSEQSLYYNGFVVDLHGNIKFPILGELNVLGYTIEEIQDLVKKELLKQYFKETAQIYVTVRLAGLKYTTIGEIGTGTHVLYQDRVNILEAIANAGNINMAGNRKDVLIIRQYPQGQKIHHIDLTDINAMKSEFYYIQPNDMIMVNPLKRKTLGAGQSPIQTLTTVVGVFSVLVSTYFIVKGL
jgi:polysaccharide biosynthesis/export protein